MLSTAGRIHCVSTMRLNIEGSSQYSSVIFDRFNVTISKDTINGQWLCVGVTLVVTNFGSRFLVRKRSLISLAEVRVVYRKM